jgi:hypothetical protein
MDLIIKNFCNIYLRITILDKFGRNNDISREDLCMLCKHERKIPLGSPSCKLKDVLEEREF